MHRYVNLIDYVAFQAGVLHTQVDVLLIAFSIAEHIIPYLTPFLPEKQKFFTLFSEGEGACGHFHLQGGTADTVIPRFPDLLGKCGIGGVGQHPAADDLLLPGFIILVSPRMIF